MACYLVNIRVFGVIFYQDLFAVLSGNPDIFPESLFKGFFFFLNMFSEVVQPILKVFVLFFVKLFVSVVQA
ncbi:hypothetical protein SDC9_150538 [bioreactor metagenome]|uniref:Uncharacterized protein n=1 Tax=bioreactor metagenome TaxID=1076179 RepID=A0A645EMS6_9ZZZZ